MATAYIALFLTFLFAFVGGQSGSFQGTPSDVTSTDGTDATISCPVNLNGDEFTFKEHISDTSGNIIWRSGATSPPVPAGYEVTGTYSLVIKNAGVDKGGHYSCELHNARTSHSVNVIILEKPSFTMTPTPDNLLIEGQPKTLVCSGQYGGPLEENTKENHKPAINLFIGGQQPPGVVPNVTKDTGKPGNKAFTITQSVYYNPVAGDNDKAVECRMATTTPQVSYSSDNRTLDIHFGVKTIVISPRESGGETTIATGERLNCTVDANPAASFTWTILEWSPAAQLPNPVTIQGSSVILQTGMIGSGHRWQCEARNTVADQLRTVTSEITFSVVEGPPTGAVGGAAFLIPCYVLTVALPVLRLLILP